MKKRWLCWLLCTLFVVGALPVEAEAAFLAGYYASLNNGWWENCTAYYGFESELMDGTYSNYTSVWSAALSSWSSGAVNFVYHQSTQTGPDVVLGIDYLAGLNGPGTITLTREYGNPGMLSNAYAAINLAFSTINENNVAQSAAAHELGHVCGLLDIGEKNPTQFVLMNVHRDRTVLYEPTFYDIEGVNLFYEPMQ